MGDPNPASFVKVEPAMIADRRLTDSEFRCLVALESWAWDKDHCYPGNVAIAERCGWYGKGKGKPARSKVKAVLASLEAKGYIRRSVVVADGHHRRERIDLARRWRDGLNPDHPRPDSRPPLAEIRATPGPDSGHPRPGNRPSLARKQATRGPNPGPELDPATDSTTDPGQQTQPPHPPTGRRGGWRSPDEKDQLLDMLKAISDPGPMLTPRQSQAMVTSAARWIAGRIPGRAVNGISQSLGRLVDGRLSLSQVFDHWSGQIEAQEHGHAGKDSPA